MSSFVCRLRSSSVLSIQESVGGPPPEQVPMSSCCVVWQSIKIKTGQSNQGFLFFSLSLSFQTFFEPSVDLLQTHMKRYRTDGTGQTQGIYHLKMIVRDGSGPAFSVSLWLAMWGPSSHTFPLLWWRWWWWVGWIYILHHNDKLVFEFIHYKKMAKVVFIQSPLSVCPSPYFGRLVP